MNRQGAQGRQESRRQEERGRNDLSVTQEPEHRKVARKMRTVVLIAGPIFLWIVLYAFLDMAMYLGYVKRASSAAIGLSIFNPFRWVRYMFTPAAMLLRVADFAFPFLALWMFCRKAVGAEAEEGTGS